MDKPKLLDLFCGAGGCSKGYQLAGFYVIGVDIIPQPRYCGDEFIQADVMGLDPEFIRSFDAVHASPPCQKYTKMAKGLLQSQGRAREYPDLVAPVRNKLNSCGNPYIIENVEGAPLDDPILLCGSMFGLLVQRHRLFESNIFLMSMDCSHDRYVADKPNLHRLSKSPSRVVGCYGNGRGRGDNVALWGRAMGIHWMSRRELSQAIPPAYTEFIGKQLMEYLGSKS